MFIICRRGFSLVWSKYVQSTLHWAFSQPGLPYVISQVHDTSLLETQAYFTTQIAHPFLVFICGFCMFLIASSLPSVLVGNHFADYEYHQHNQERKWGHILISCKTAGYICEIVLSLWCPEKLCKTKEQYSSFISKLKRMTLKTVTEKAKIFLRTLLADLWYLP